MAHAGGHGAAGGGAGGATATSRAGDGWMPAALPSKVPKVVVDPMPDVTAQRLQRIRQRSRNPRRRDKLAALLRGGGGDKKAGGSRPPPPGPTPPATLSRPPSLPSIPRLSLRGDGSGSAPEVDPDMEQLNRNLLWEEMVKADAARGEAAVQFQQDLLAEQRRKTAAAQLAQAKRAERRRRRERRKELGPVRQAVLQDVAAFEAESAAAEEARKRAAADLLAFQIKQDEERRAAEEAERTAKLEQERRELEETAAAEAAAEELRQRQLQQVRELGLEARRMADSRKRKEARQLRRERRKDAEMESKPDPFLTAIAQREAARKAELQAALTSIEGRAEAAAPYVDADRVARDTVAVRHAEDVTEARLKAAEELEAARDAAKRQALKQALEAQVREKELRRRVEDAEREAEAARERQEAARRDADYAARKAELAEKAFYHKLDLDEQLAGEQYNKVYGYDRGGRGVSEAEWRLNQGLLKTLQGAARAATTTPAKRSSRQPQFVARPSRGAAGGALAALGVSGRSVRSTTSTRRTATGRSGGSTRVWGARQHSASSLSLHRPPFDVGTPQSTGVGAARPAVAAPLRLTALDAMGSGFDGDDLLADAPEPYHGRAKVEWYDK